MLDGAFTSDAQIAALAARVEAQIAEAARDVAQEVESPPERVATPRRGRPFASYRALVVSWAFCLGLTVFNLESGGLFAPRAIEREPFEVIAGLKIAAALDAVLIEDYRAANGNLPLGLADVGLPDDDPTLDYERTGDGFYRVTARHASYEGVFDSRVEAERQAAAAEARAAEARLLAARREEQAAEAERWAAEAKERKARLRRRAREEQARESSR